MEQELKIALSTLKDWEGVRTALGEPMARKLQENHYFDTPDRRLREHRATFRIRIENGTGEMTVKRRAAIGEVGYMQAEEDESPIPLAVARACIDAPETILMRPEPPAALAAALVDGTSLAYIGCGRTERLVYDFKGFVLELDRVTFPSGAQDYEIEVETPDLTAIQAVLLPFLDRHQISCEPQTRTKYRRFLDDIGDVSV